MITVDTNILVYVFDDDEPAKQAISVEILDRLLASDAVVGLQAIGELQNVLKRKLKMPPWQAAQEARNVLAAFSGSFPPTEKAVEDALGLMATGRLSYWDALLVASARDAGCKALLSEDMGGQPRWLTVEIVNPFASDGGTSKRALELLAS